MPVYKPPRKVTPRLELARTAQGLLSETFDRRLALGNTLLTNQQVEYSLVGLRGGDLITNVYLITSAAATSGTSGTGTVAIYTSAGVRSVSSADATTLFTAAAGLKTIPLTSPWTVPVDGGYYVALLTTYVTTQPTVTRYTTVNNGSIVIGAGVRPWAIQTAQTNLP